MITRHPITVSSTAAALVAAALVSVASPHSAAALIPAIDAPRQDTSPHGMVAAAHPLAVEAGLRMLEQGGNAVDAAAAVAFAITVVEPFGSSIGGDGNALIYFKTTGEVKAFDYRATAPRRATAAVYPNDRRAQWTNSPLGPGVPGMIAGTCAMHEEYGLLPLATVIAPAIAYAEQGYPAGRALVEIINDTFPMLSADDELSGAYLVDGLPPDVGQTLTNPQLAQSLRLLAATGPDAFYRGPLGETVTTWLQSKGGIMTMQDLADYRVQRRNALSIEYRGAVVHSAPPPFGGIAVLQNLQLLRHLPLDVAKGPSHPDNLHLMAEAMKISSRDRSRVSGDPNFVNVPVEEILSPEYNARRAAEIKLAQATTSVTPSDEAPDNPWGNTTHLTIVDSQGNAVSLTQTLGGWFGSGQMVPGTGIVLNDQMKNFSPRRNSPNVLAPGKRMNSTQSPTLVTRDGQLILAVGSPGNYRIISTVTQVLVNYLDFQMPIQDAINAPRLSARFDDPKLSVEGDFPAATLDALRAHGHDLAVKGTVDLFFGGVHAIHRDPATGMLTGAADPRRDGVAKGLRAVPKPAAAPTSTPAPQESAR